MTTGEIMSVLISITDDSTNDIPIVISIAGFVVWSLGRMIEQITSDRDETHEKHNVGNWGRGNILCLPTQ